ncbi:hypothetical protein EW146_g10306 [Bondarzewia mesenterica]|uniref:Uncharacterized protein n=1 Tax=Bondarzewia mesenterica TaxID=1095465 RepID=A0A4S4KYH4_9AGAM|nr:hypothetical protein EW146_g10306 [Bondarzewia mesenterica]
MSGCGWRHSSAFCSTHIHIPGTEESRVTPRANSIAVKKLIYLVIYTITVPPIAIVRYTAFSHPNHEPHLGATIFAEVVFCSSGLLNVLLYKMTRRFLLPHHELQLSNVLMSDLFTRGRVSGRRRT